MSYEMYKRPIALFAALFSLVLVLAFSMVAANPVFIHLNEQSDIPGVAVRTDANMINPWGVAYGPGGPLWVNDNNAGVSELLLGNGVPFPTNGQLVVTIPPPAGGTPPAAPTGIVFNPTNGFQGTVFIFDTEDGTISGWNPGVNFTNALLEVDNSHNAVDGFKLGAVYKGLAIGQTPAGATQIYATNFRDGVVEVYDSNFAFKGFFTDPTITPDGANPGFAPFGIQNINGQLYVTFAMQKPSRHDNTAGVGLGFVDIFDTSGNFVKQFTSGGTLNAPWGLALAPSNFGAVSGDILVGNFGDGRINAYDTSGNFVGQLHDTIGQPLAIQGLWTLIFGDGHLAGPTNVMVFTAGIGGEQHGLFGGIRPKQ